MSIKNLSHEAISEINQSVAQPLTQSEIDSVSKIIEKKLILAIKESVQKCSNKAVHCCGAESDMAHKI